MEKKEEPLLTMRNVTKRFPGVLALDNMMIDLYPGEVHVLIGENGAGKSTLMKVLSGVYQMDEGEITYRGEALKIHSVKDAQQAGISIIHQELNLLSHRTVFQNIFLGREPLKEKGPKFIDEKKMINDSAALLNRLNLSINPKELVSSLSIANRQMVEVAKALSYDAKVLIMDEPTSSISGKEVEDLFNIIRELKGKGVAVVYISHRMEELLTIGDRVTVMRDGRHIGTRMVSDISIDELVEMMVGRKIEQYYNRQERTPGDIMLKTNKLSGLRFKDVDITVRKGEIVCLAGLVGAGRTEICKSIFGYDPITGGSFEYNGVVYNKMKPRKATESGMGFVPEDRRNEGLILNMSIEDNTILASLDEVFGGPVVKRRLSREIAEKQAQALELTPPDVANLAGNLSGGNQQKVVLARWLCRECKLFIMDEPTRGVDVGAKSDIYGIISRLAANGAGVLVVSSDLPEVIGISDRVYVISDGRVAGELTGKDITSVKIGEYMLERI